MTHRTFDDAIDYPPPGGPPPNDYYGDGYYDDDDPEPRRKGDTVRTVVRGVGQTLITFGLVVLLFVVYELYITDLFNAQKQSEMKTELQKEWEANGPTVPGGPEEKFAEVALGEGFAIIWIPKFGSDWAKVVLEGTDEDELVDGPGHYVDTAMPGEVGNFSLAGHRVGKGSPFLNLDKLAPNDAIVIETAENWYVYRVLADGQIGGVPSQQIVTPTDVDVISPVPNDPAGTASMPLITLTTCHPKFSAEQRLIVHGVLEGAPLSKSQYPKPGDVPALKEK